MAQVVGIAVIGAGAIGRGPIHALTAMSGRRLRAGLPMRLQKPGQRVAVDLSGRNAEFETVFNNGSRA